MAITERQREYNRLYRRQERAKLVTGFKAHKMMPEPRPDPSVLAMRRAEIPEDNRDLTARICGDPLPGRRAIDQRRSA